MAADEHDALIEKLKAQAADAAGGWMVSHESGDMSPDQREQFWRGVVARENAETTDLITELKAVGVDLPPPDSLDDIALHRTLWTVLRALAEMGVFLDQTNHLSDRELYTLLWSDLLPQQMDALDEDTTWHIDILGGGSLEDVRLYLLHYADEETRRDWRTEFPDMVIPEHQDPPYDRDRHLP